MPEVRWVGTNTDGAGNMFPVVRFCFHVLFVKVAESLLSLLAAVGMIRLSNGNHRLPEQAQMRKHALTKDICGQVDFMCIF